MIRFQDSNQLNTYIKNHESDFQPIQSGKVKFINKQKHLLIGSATEKHGTLWKVTRILKIAVLFPLSVCSSKLKKKFSKAFTEFKTGECQLKIYALEKICKGQNLNLKNIENLNKENEIDPTHEVVQNSKKDIEAETPIEKSVDVEKKDNDANPSINSSITPEEFEQLLNSSSQDIKLLRELIYRVCKTNNLDQLVQIFSKLDVKQIQNYFNGLKDSYNQSYKESIDAKKELESSTKENMSEWSSGIKSVMQKIYGLQKQVTEEKFNELTSTHQTKKAEYELLKNQAELAYANIVLSCQKLDEAKSNEVLNGLLDALRQFNKSDLNLIEKIMPILTAPQCFYILSSNHKEFVDSREIESLIEHITSNEIALKNFVATLDMTFFSRWFAQSTDNYAYSTKPPSELLQRFFVEMHQQKKLIPFIKENMFRYGNPMTFLLIKPLSKEELIPIKYKFVMLTDDAVETLYRSR